MVTPAKVIEAAINSCKDPMAKCHVESIQFYSGYAEPGYTDPPSGIIAVGNWNSTHAFIQGQGYVGEEDKTPERVGECLEKLGVELEWEDEWCSCDDCNKLMRTQPDCHWWTPSYVEDFKKGTLLCKECAKIYETTDDDED